MHQGARGPCSFLLAEQTGSTDPIFLSLIGRSNTKHEYVAAITQKKGTTGPFMKLFKGQAFWASGLLLGILSLSGAKALSQASTDNSALPDDPGALVPQQVASSDSISPTDPLVRPEPPIQSTGGRQTKRILYMVPNFRAVSANSQLQPQDVKEKLKTASLDSLDYSSFIFYGVQSGISFVDNSYPEFHQGAAGYGRYYWHTMADSTDENYWVEFIVPAALHQDTRYYTLGKGGFTKRFAYAFSRTFITRTDLGSNTLNTSEILGSGVAASISNLYYPSPERTFTKTYQRWLTSFVIDGGVFVFKEFWPDINDRFFHQTND
jgi:hypothetical protein